MSNFQGRIEELHGILVDNFLENDIFTCFFLSHCHADHMIGVESLLTKIQNQSNQYLYCSPISRLILIKKFNLPSSFGFIKELTSPTPICVPGTNTLPGYQITVTPIPAGHCAGAVMFLFESTNKVILYTGDFRINKNDISKFNSLHHKSHVKHIDKLYVDATFLNKSYWHFPKRSEVVILITDIIHHWLCQNPNNQIFLQTSASFGYEYAFVEISRRLKQPIHVNDLLFNIYSHVPDIVWAVTDNCNRSRIHAFNKIHAKCLKNNEIDRHFTIRLSAVWYRSPKGTEPKSACQQIKKHQIQVCYSNHCSCSELVEVIKYLNPAEIESFTSTVGYTDEKQKSFVMELLNLHSFNNIKEPIVEMKTHNFLERNYRFKLKFTDNQRNP